MKLRTRLLALASAVGMVAGFGIIGASPAGAVTTYAVGNDHLTCSTLAGTIKFTSHLKNSGATTGVNTITVALTLAGCVDDDKGAVKMFKGASTVKLTT